MRPAWMMGGAQKHIRFNPTETINMTDSKGVSRVNEGKLSITQVDTSTLVINLQGLFQKVMSGEDYNKEQVKSAVNLSNAMIKIVRFEFDKFKYFHDRLSSTEL